MGPFILVVQLLLSVSIGCCDKRYLIHFLISGKSGNGPGVNNESTLLATHGGCALGIAFSFPFCFSCPPCLSRQGRSLCYHWVLIHDFRTPLRWIAVLLLKLSFVDVISTIKDHLHLKSNLHYRVRRSSQRFTAT